MAYFLSAAPPTTECPGYEHYGLKCVTVLLGHKKMTRVIISVGRLETRTEEDY